ncbi:MAG: signal peptidase I [Alphaproteobacteria bacterium PA2]|nr:MAG: signal peptidase I [Alphaproteobacteria bacterium PA2]
MTSNPTSEEDAAPPAALKELAEIVWTIGLALILTLILKVLIFQPFTIPSASMEPNLLEGDYIVVSKFSYGFSRHSIPLSPPVMTGRIFGREPQRGDVVVFKLPRDGRTDYIKRLIGLPGDRVQMKGGVIYLNDAPVPRRSLPTVMMDSGYGFTRSVERFEETLSNGRKYVTYDYGSDGDLDNTAVFVVPAGQYFVLGDNRDNSLDSRVPNAIGVGFVPAENIVGKAQVILLSWNKGASLLEPWTWFTHARPDRFFRSLR